MKEDVINYSDQFVDTFKYQKEWIEGRGLLLLFAIFTGELGAGTFLISVYRNFFSGIFIGIAIVAIFKTAFHILFLGQPLKFWRAFTRPQSSWISRGVIIMTIFIVSGLLYILPSFDIFSFLPWKEGTILNKAILTIAIISAFGEIIYVGFLMSFNPAIPFWNTGLLPILFSLYSLLNGAALTLIILPGETNIGSLRYFKMIEIWLTISVIVNIISYVWSMYYTNIGGKESAYELIKGRISFPFIGGVIILGIMIPLVIALYSYFTSLPYIVFGIGAFLSLIGGLLFRYSILKAGIFPPLFPLFTQIRQ